jgi:hypothetical protein
MVFIGTNTQTRLLELAKRQFGPGGDVILRDAAHETCNVPFEQITFLQLPAVFKAVERDAPRVGARFAAALAAELDRLVSEAETDLLPRLHRAISKHLGRATGPMIEQVCARLGFLPATVNRDRLPDVARLVEQDTTPLLGAEVARALAMDILAAADATPQGLSRRIIDLAVDYLGQDGEAFLRRLCRERLEIHIEELNLAGVKMLARVLERHGAAMIGSARVAAFLAAARITLNSPNEQLRTKIVELVTRHVGPAGRDFLHEICLEGGLPFQAIDYEHLMWLSEALRREAAPLAGKKGAEELARAVRGLLTGAR